MSRILLLLFTGLVLNACNVDSEKDDLAKAQKCLDEIPVSSYAQATSCLQHIEKYSSQQANILKCSIYMTAGGLVESKIVDAYQILSQGSGTQASKEAKFMALLSFSDSNSNGFADEFATAQTADDFCQLSGVGGLQYLSGLIVTGTYMRKLSEVLTGDPNRTIEQVVTDIVQQCAVSAPAQPDPDCFSPANIADLNAMGGAIADVAQSYCDRADADAAVCTGINSALEQAGTDTSDIGQALICYMGGKRYDPANDICL